MPTHRVLSPATQKQSANRMRISHRLVHVSLLLILLLGSGAGLIAELIRRHQLAQVKERSEQISLGLQKNVEMFFREHTGLLVFISALYRDGLIHSQKDFSYYGSQLFSLVSGFRGISATNTNYQLVYQYPLGNRFHDIRNYPDRIAFVERAVRTRNITVTDPLQLVVSGVQGFAVYVPIFDGDQFKGLIVGIFDINQLIDRQLKPLFQGIPFTISLENGSTFYRTADAPAGKASGAAAIPIHLADKTWIIHCLPPNVALNTITYDRAIVLVAIVMLIAFCVVLQYALQMNRLDVQSASLTRFERDYSTVLTKLDEKFKENVNLYEQLARTQGDLVKATRLAALGEISTVVAHEIRNPLTALISCIDSLKHSLKADGEDAELLNVSMKEAMRLNNTVSDLLNFARPRALITQQVKIEELLDEVTWSFCKDARWKRKVKVRRRCSGLCPTAEVDPNLMREVLWNLMINAAQAMDSGGEITLTCTAVNGHAQVVVKDEGRGIPDGIQGRIFDPFFSTKASGVGLGLFIVKRIVEDHGGYVAVESEEGRGAMFKVNVPLRAEEVNVLVAGS